MVGVELSSSSVRVSAQTEVYDFVAHAAEASWSSGAGALPFPGSPSDSRGFARYVYNATLEDGSVWQRVLETHPQWVSNGYIMGTYPQQTVAQNVQLKVKVGFLSGATGTDGAIFEVRFHDLQQNSWTLFSYKATYDAKLDSIVKDLRFLAGKTGRFILWVNATQSSGQDWAVWAEARIETIPLPDLVITDVWQNGSTICYKVKNVGDANIGSLGALAKFCNVLFIDGKQVARDDVTLMMTPGQEVERCFSYQWQWTASQHTVRVCADWEQNIAEKDEQNNCREETWYAPPDLTTQSISFMPEEPRVGEKVNITVVVKNIGNGTAGACQGALLVGKVVNASLSIPSLKPGESRSLMLTWTPSVNGTQELVFSVDHWNAVAESNEYNNQLARNINVLPALGRPDLEAVGLTWTPEVTTANHTATFKPQVRNLGESASPPCVAELYANGTKIGSAAIPSIPGGGQLEESAEVFFRWTPPAEGLYRLRLLVDADEAVDELDEENNAVETLLEVKAPDTTPPTVTIFYADPHPTERDPVLFFAYADDPSGIASITIYVNGMAVQTLYNVNSCEYTGGPYPRRSTVFYAAQAFDKAGNGYITPWYNFTVSSYYPGSLTVEVAIDPSEPTEIDEVNFTARASYPYGVTTLRIYLNGVKVKEALNATSSSILRGPWAPGYTVRYYAEAYSVDGDYARTPERSFTVAALGRENVKNLTSYRDREVFVISDLDWRAVLSLVPIAVWREMNPTEPVAPGTIYSFPVLIFHQENETSFDADSTIRFLQQYAEYGRNRVGMRVTILGDPPDELVRLMVAPPPLGAGLDESQVRVWRGRAETTTESRIRLATSPLEAMGLRGALEAKWGVSVHVPEGSGAGVMPARDIFSLEEERQLRADYWSNIDVYVLSEDEYATGLMASVYASLLNAPLLFQGHYDIAELDHKSVRLVGSFSTEEVQALEAANVRVLQRWTLEELCRNYVIATGTNKVILVNPLDLWTSRNYSYTPDKASTPVSFLYGKHSLAAPFLAAAKKEVIISTTATSYVDIDIFVKESIESLLPGVGLKYLTIVASPEVIPIARPNLPYAPSLVGRLIYYQASPYVDVDVAWYDLGLERQGYLTSSGRVQYSPAASQYVVAWVDEDTWGDIWYRDLSTGRDIRLTDEWAGQSRPAVYGTRIVWQDGRNWDSAKWDIYVHDASTHSTVRVTSSTASQEWPAIWDTTIVWQDDRNGRWDIYKYDLRTGEEERVTSDPWEQERPSISWNKIVYCDYRHGNWEIYMSWLGAGGRGVAGERRITNNPAMQWNPRIYGSRIVWQDNRHGNWDIYMYDLDTETERRITYEPIDQVLPTIWEDRVAWLERSEEGWWYICVYDIATGSYRRVVRTEVSADDGVLWLEVDGRYYGSTENLAHQDIATGRIYGVTVADASAYIARDLFYNRINKNRDALVVVREDWQDEIGGGGKDEAVLERYARSHYWTDEVEDHFRNVQFYSGHDEVAAYRDAIYSSYDDCGLLIFVDHGWQGGFVDMMDSDYLYNNKVQLQPATVLDLACLTGAYYVEVTTGGRPPMLFAAQNIRRGAMVYMGATDVSYWHTMFDDILYGVYEGRKTIGESYLEARNEDYDEDRWNFSLTLRGDIVYALLGDPAFQPKWEEWELEERWWP
ncbi:MAG: CARDB domain-containing protein [Candidatus Bathyarchaeia archaeon]